jgi:hypothetical protein
MSSCVLQHSGMTSVEIAYYIFYEALEERISKAPNIKKL